MPRRVFLEPTFGEMIFEIAYFILQDMASLLHCDSRYLSVFAVRSETCMI